VNLSPLTPDGDGEAPGDWAEEPYTVRTRTVGHPERAANRPGVRGRWAAGVVGTRPTRFNAGELGTGNSGVRM